MSLPEQNGPPVWDVSRHDYAHRGLWRPDGPSENSIPSFIAARRFGFGVEFDVRLTRDGQPVVYHDENLRRLCGLDENLCDLMLADLTSLRLPDGSCIPSLGAAISELGETPSLIEIKTFEDPEQIAWEVIRGVRPARGRFALMSFSRDTIDALLRSAHGLPVGLLIDASDASEIAGPLDWALTRGCAFAGPNHALQSRPEIAGYPLPCVMWTISRVEDFPERPNWAPIFEGLEPDVVRRRHDV